MTEEAKENEILTINGINGSGNNDNIPVTRDQTVPRRENGNDVTRRVNVQTKKKLIIFVLIIFIIVVASVGCFLGLRRCKCKDKDQYEYRNEIPITTGAGEEIIVEIQRKVNQIWIYKGSNVVVITLRTSLNDRNGIINYKFLLNIMMKKLLLIILKYFMLILYFKINLV